MRVKTVFLEEPMSVDFLQNLVCTFMSKGKQLAIKTAYATNILLRVAIFVHVKGLIVVEIVSFTEQYLKKMN